MLLKRGYTDRKTLQEIVNRQTHDQALQLSNWTTGTFKFVIPDREIRFPITPSIDVQNLLLEASRRLDEGERPQAEKIHVEEEICLTCTIPAPTRSRPGTSRATSACGATCPPS